MFKISQPVLAAALGFLFFTACSHAPKKTAPMNAAEKNDSKLEALAATAVEKTEADEKMAPQIQKSINAIFFQGKAENPGGLDAFAPDRIQELEVVIMQTESGPVKYYRENRDYFDRFEDAGGGFRVVANAKRLVPYRWSKTGRKKLFVMDTARVKEMIAHPCFSAIEDCGEYSSDGEENTALLDEWSKKYAEPDYQEAREKVLRKYLGSLEKYQKRVARGLPKKTLPAGTPETPKAKRAKQAAALVETHIRGIQLLLKD